MSWNTVRVDRWIFKGLTAVVIIAAGFRLALGNTSAGAISVWVGGAALLAVIPWLGLRWLAGESARQSTEDKIVQEVRTHWLNHQTEKPAADLAPNEEVPAA